MKSEERLKIIKRLHEDELAMIETKGREYTGGAEAGNDLDTLHNFKDVAEQTGMTALQCWGVYFLKHISAIMTYVKDPERDLSEPIDGRIMDARTYLGLLQCLIDEANGPAPCLPSDEDKLREMAHAAFLDGQERVAARRTKGGWLPSGSGTFIGGAYVEDLVDLTETSPLPSGMQAVRDIMDVPLGFPDNVASEAVASGSDPIPDRQQVVSEIAHEMMVRAKADEDIRRQIAEHRGTEHRGAEHG